MEEQCYKIDDESSCALSDSEAMEYFCYEDRGCTEDEITKLKEKGFTGLCWTGDHGSLVEADWDYIEELLDDFYSKA